MICVKEKESPSPSHRLTSSPCRLTCWLVVGQLVLLLLVREAAAQIRVDGNWSPWSTLSSYCVQSANRYSQLTGTVSFH